jgi:hypothetical protein
MATAMCKAQRCIRKPVNSEPQIRAPYLFSGDEINMPEAGKNDPKSGSWTSPSVPLAVVVGRRDNLSVA